MSSESIFWITFAKPFVAFVLLAIAAVAAWGLARVIPDGPIKAFLYRVRDLENPTPEREAWKVKLFVLLLIIGFFLYWLWLTDQSLLLK